MNAKVICVVNNWEIFDKVVKTNENLKNCVFFVSDNTKENVAITKRYNSFIENEAKNEESWCIFIHQDFGIMEDIDLVLKKLNPDYIYGAVGVKTFKGIFFGKKNKNKKLGFKTSFKLMLGRILQGNNDCNFKKRWSKALFQPTVDAIDCCCIIMHSSLIKKHHLRFDENLDFHLYAEELCYSSKKAHQIKTKVVQMKCYHLGQGKLDENFEKSAKYLKEKFNIEQIPSTCST